MEIFGDLERFFVDVIWPVRVPLAIALVVGMAVFVFIAWRRVAGGLEHEVALAQGQLEGGAHD